jgi:hypothetical protein
MSRKMESRSRSRNKKKRDVYFGSRIHAGSISSFGYHIDLQVADRHRALLRAVRHEGYLPIFRHLIARSNLTHRTNPRMTAIMRSDAYWLRDQENTKRPRMTEKRLGGWVSGQGFDSLARELLGPRYGGKFNLSEFNRKLQSHPLFGSSEATFIVVNMLAKKEGDAKPLYGAIYEEKWIDDKTAPGGPTRTLIAERGDDARERPILMPYGHGVVFVRPPTRLRNLIGFGSGAHAALNRVLLFSHDEKQLAISVWAKEADQESEGLDHVLERVVVGSVDANGQYALVANHTVSNPLPKVKPTLPMRLPHVHEGSSELMHVSPTNPVWKYALIKKANVPYVYSTHTYKGVAVERP